MRSPKVRQSFEMNQMARTSHLLADCRSYDSFGTVLVRMYEEPERPQQALDFIKQYLGASVGVDHEAMKQVRCRKTTTCLAC